MNYLADISGFESLDGGSTFVGCFNGNNDLMYVRHGTYTQQTPRGFVASDPKRSVRGAILSLNKQLDVLTKELSGIQEIQRRISDNRVKMLPFLKQERALQDELSRSSSDWLSRVNQAISDSSAIKSEAKKFRLDVSGDLQLTDKSLDFFSKIGRTFRMTVR